MERTARLLVAAALVGALTASAPGSGQASEEWSLDILPALSTPVGDLPSVAGLDLNENGQVAGNAHDPLHIAAFRYTQGVGMEDLDPDGRYRSTVRNGGSMNDRGDILMLTRDDNGAQIDLFLHTVEDGLLALEQGKNPRVRTTFRLFPGVTGIPNTGHFCGFVSPPSGGAEPYVYRPDTGWESLRRAHPRFRSDSTVCKYMNDRGDLVFAVAEDGDQEAFVSVDGGRPIELPGFDRNVNVTGEISESGVIPGLYLDARGRERAYVWSSEAGMVELPRQRRLRQAAALFATTDGTVWGLLTKRTRLDTIFSWSESEGLAFRVRRPRLRRFVRRHGLRFGSASIASANDRGAIVGRIQAVPGEWLPYYYSAETGLVDLVRVVATFGVDFVPTVAREVNDRGQVLLGGATVDGARSVTAILSREDG